MKIFFLLMLLLKLTPLSANSPIIINNERRVFQDFPLEMYKDNSAKLSFNEIKNINNFTPTSNKISQGYSNANLWFKFQLKNDLSEDINYILYFTENLVHYLDCYIVNSDGTFNKYTQGIGHYIKDAPNKLHNPQFNFVLKKKTTKTIYIKMFSRYANFGAFYLFDEKSFYEYQMLYNSLYSAYFGAVIALLFYNIFLYFFTKSISYFYYVCLGTSYLLWQLTFNSFPPFNTFYSIEGYYIAGSPVNFMIMFIVLFTRSLLATKESFPLLDKLLLFLTFIMAILTFLLLVFAYQVTFYINILATVIFPLILFTGIKSYLNDNKLALFFIIAQLLFLSSSTILSLMMEGTLPYTLFTRHTIVVASFIELTLFSLTLGYNIKLLKDDKMALIKNASKRLEKQVEERTKELLASQNVLKEMVIKDPMTNLYNRRHLIEISQIMIDEKNNFSIIMLDIDKFKNINDTYGHNVGDKIIIIFANILIAHTRDNDYTFRIGGEEFVILLPNTDSKTTYQIASRIREFTEKKIIELNEQFEITFTVSGGISTLLNTDKDIDDIIIRADTALYKAKNSGRNQIQIFSKSDTC